MDIPFFDLQNQQLLIKDKLLESINKTLRHGQYILGPEVKYFENLLSEYCQVKHSITCGNGTDALLLSLMALEIKENDIVLCPSFSFVATAEMVPLLGGKLMFVDVEYENFNIDINSLKSCIRYLKKINLKPKGIITVDLFGHPANLEEIELLAQEEQIWMICDAAQSFGSSINKKKIGSFGDITTTSFFPSKPLGAYGDGGAIFTNKDWLAEKIFSLRAHGKSKSKYINKNIGINSRLDSIQAGILVEKLSIFNKEIILRNEIAEIYSNELNSFLKVPRIKSGYKVVWAQYTLNLDNKKNRSEILQKLTEENIPTMIYYPVPIHEQSPYKNSLKDPNGLNVSKKLSQNVFSIPIYPYLESNKQEFIIDKLKKYSA